MYNQTSKDKILFLGKWERKPFSRKEFNKLFKITPEMDDIEIEKRIKATNYLHFKPIIIIGGYTFELKK
jgi:hypothetical protein